MLRNRAARILAVWLSSVWLLSSKTSEQSSFKHVFFRVQAAASAPEPLNGRLLIFLKKGTGDKSIDLNEFHPTEISVAAQELRDLEPGQSVELDADLVAFPKPFSEMAAGDYEAQAVLDTGHDYNYRGRRPSDWISRVIPLSNWTPGNGTEPLLVLDQHPPANQQHADAMSKAMA